MKNSSAVAFFLLARITTIIVTATNSAKIPMLATGCRRSRPRRRGCGRSCCAALQLGADGFGARIEFTVGEPDVDAGDDECGDELSEADQQADVDVAAHLGRHEVVGERAEQDVGEIPDEEEAVIGKTKRRSLSRSSWNSGLACMATNRSPLTGIVGAVDGRSVSDNADS